MEVSTYGPMDQNHNCTGFSLLSSVAQCCQLERGQLFQLLGGLSGQAGRAACPSNPCHHQVCAYLSKRPLEGVQTPRSFHCPQPGRQRGLDTQDLVWGPS